MRDELLVGARNEEAYVNLPSVPARRIAYTTDAIFDQRSFPPESGVEIYCGSAVSAVAMYEQSTSQIYENRMTLDLFWPLDMQNASFDALSSTSSVTGVWNHSGTAPNLSPIMPADQHVQRSPAGGVGASAVDMGKYLNYALTSHPERSDLQSLALELVDIDVDSGEHG